jgi:hypothetical protein
MGTPYWGSPKVYYGLVNGYSFGNPSVKSDLMKILAQNYASAYQLLPRKPFVTDAATKKPLSLGESYGIWYKWFADYANLEIDDQYTPTTENTKSFNPHLLEQRKSFYSKIGDQDGNVNPLPSGVKQYVIIGHGISTLSGYELVDWSPGWIKVWPFTTTFLELANGRKVVLRPQVNEGDGTVPIWSLEIPSTATKTYYVPYKTGWVGDESSEHGYLAQNKTVQSIVGQIVKNNPPEPSNYPRPQFYMDTPTGQLKELENLATFELHSDAHLRIVNANGAALGFNDAGGIDETLPGTFLSMDGIEYTSIADLNATYKVQVNGIADGKFTLAVQIKKAGKLIDSIYDEVPVKKGTVAQFDLDPKQVTTSLPPLIVTTDGRTASIPAQTKMQPGGQPASATRASADLVAALPFVLGGGAACLTIGVFLVGILLITRAPCALNWIRAWLTGTSRAPDRFARARCATQTIRFARARRGAQANRFAKIAGVPDQFQGRRAKCQPPIHFKKPKPSTFASKVRWLSDVSRASNLRTRWKNLMLQDAQGRWWMLGIDSGRWCVSDGKTWIEAQPPTLPAAPPALPGKPLTATPTAAPPPIYIVQAPAPVPPPAPQSRGGGCGCRGCLFTCLLLMVLLAVITAGGFLAYQSGAITPTMALNLVGLGPGDIEIDNFRDDTLYVTITRLDAPPDSTPARKSLEIKSFDIQAHRVQNPGKYRVEFGAARASANLGTCTLQIRSGDQYQFVPLPNNIVVNRANNPVSVGADFVVATSALCR